MEKYFVGLDNGGTNIKAIVFDAKGKVISQSSIKTPIITPESGFTERDMEDLWQKNCECIREAVNDSNVDSEKIIGLAISGHGKGLYAWGKDHMPAYNGIVSTDNRAWRYPAKWKEDGTFSENYPKLCQNLMASQQLSLLAWFKDNHREVYDNIRYVFSVKDYLRFRFTDEAYCEVTDISGSGLLNVRDRKFDREQLESFGIGEMYDCLPPLKYSYEACGKVTEEASKLCGLAVGTAVGGGMFDIDACAIAMRVLDPEDMITISGTWSINEYISETPIVDESNIMMNSLYAIPGYYLIEECSATSAGNLEWFLDEFIDPNEIPEGSNIYAYVESMIQKTKPETSDVYFLPFLYASNIHPLGKASFVGMTSFHTKADLLRSIYEGVAFSHRMHLERLISTRDKPKSIRLAGGVTNSEFWTQLFADVIGYPLETVDVKELGSLGAAMSASVASGVYKDYREASEHMTRPGSIIRPNVEMQKLYDAKYAKYLKVCEALNRVWDEFTV